MKACGKEETSINIGLDGQRKVEGKTHAKRIVLGDFVSCMIDENICKISLLMDDAQKVALVVRERRLWLLRESLYATERRVLDDDVRCKVLHD